MKGEVCLKRSEDFVRLYRIGSYSSCPFVAIKSAPNNLETTRLAISVSKKIGSAVVRNRIKRRFREIFRGIKLSQSYDIVVLARRGSAVVNFSELKGSTVDLLNKKGLIEQI